MIAEKVFNPKLAPDFQVILDATSDLIWAFDKDYQLAYCNTSFKSNFELFLHEKINAEKNLDEYDGLKRFEELSEKWSEWYRKAFAGEQFIDKAEYKISGKTLYYSLEFKPVIRMNEVTYVQVSAREETIKHSYEELQKQSANCEECELKLNEDKDDIIKERDDAIALLMENAERLQMVFEGSNDGFWDWNLEKNDIFHSRNFYEILGFRNGELKSDVETWKSRIHPDDVDRVTKALNDHLEGKTDKYDCEYRILTKTEKWKWVLDKGKVAIRNAKNKPIRIAGTLSDITERKEAESKLLESEKQFYEITSVLAEGLFVIDNNWNLKFANPEFEHLLGYSKEDIQNKNIHDIIHRHENSTDHVCPIAKVLVEGEVLRISQDYYSKKDGDYLPVSYVSSPIKRNGVITGCVTAFHDISERLQAEEELARFVEELQYNKELVEENANQFVELNQQLEESQTRLEDLNASKDKFFSIISHDLRSPFTSIIGFSEVMLEDIDTLSKEDIKDFTTSIYKSSKNIQNLLENLLQWSRVQTGRIEFNPHSFVLNNVVNDILALFQVSAARKKINLYTDLEDQFTIYADQFMIDTIIRNLVSNSIKFTKAGGEIKISASKIENDLEVTIADTGVGMSEEIKNKLFKIDEHVTTRGTEKEKGTGLGLILCKEFVEKHEGKIWVESTLGQGSQFKFIIPLKNNR